MARKKKEVNNVVLTDSPIEQYLNAQIPEIEEPIEENNQLIDEHNREIIEENQLIDEQQKEEAVIIEKKERPKFYIKPVKSFGKKINYQLVDEIANNREWLKQIAEMEYRVTSDDWLRRDALKMYPNIREIKNEKDREVVEDMFFCGNEEILLQFGYDLFAGYLKQEEDFFYIFYNNEIVGHGRVFHLDRLCCDVNINVRGSSKVKSSACNELIKYWGARYAKAIYNQGYKAAFCMTLTDKHANLPKKVAQKEYDIILNRLKLEDPSADAKGLEAKAGKLSPGWKHVGAVVLRSFAGKVVKETHWKYDLVQKFNEHI